MAVLAKIRHTDDESVEEWLFFCPACKCGHVFTVKAPATWIRRGRWHFNGNTTAASFYPSLLHEAAPASGEYKGRPRCHLFVTAGIEYCADSTHELAGKSVPLPEIAGASGLVSDVPIRAARERDRMRS